MFQLLQDLVALTASGRRRWALLAAVAALAPAGPALAQTDPQAQQPPSDDQSQTPPQHPHRHRPRPADKPGDKTPAKPAKPAPAGATTVRGVTVTAKSDMRTSIDRITYDISKDLQVEAGGSVADALRDVPGVDVDLNGKISIRGDSGVQILVDGKPSSLFSGPGSGQALLTVPADEYERVEVMTNPSAEFSPDGSAGIINLISKQTKRGGRKGVSGSVRASVSPDGRYNVGVNGAYHAGSLTVTGNLFWRHEIQKGDSTDTREGFDPTGAPTFSTDTVGVTHGDRDSYAARGKVDYDLDDATRLSAGITVFGSNAENRATSTIIAEDGTGTVIQDEQRTGRTDTDLTHATAEASLRHDFAGDQHNLSISLQQSRTPYDSSQNFTDDNIVPAIGEAFDKQVTDSITNLTDFKVDYQRPMPLDGRFKTGVEVKIENDDVDNSGFEGALTPTAPSSPGETDIFHFKRQIDSLYTTYQQPMGKLTVLAGLRYETSAINIDDVTSATTAKNDHGRFYPSLHLQWDLTDTQALVASYSQRVQRPQPMQFDPFPVIQNPLNISEGNPNLQPQETQSWEAGYRYRQGTTNYLATFFYKDNQHTVTTVQDSLGDGVLLSTLENLGHSKQAGLELIAAAHVTPTLNFNISGDASWDQIDARALGFAQLRSGYSGRARGSVNWQVTPMDLLQAHVNFFGQRLAPQGFTEPRGALNLGYRHKFDTHLSMLVTAQDVLYTMRNDSILDTSTLREDNRNRSDSRVVFLSLVYAFGFETRRDRDIDYDDSDDSPQQ